MSVVSSGYEIDLNFIGVCMTFPLFFESVDVVDVSLSGKGAVIWVESVGDNLGDNVGVCNVELVVWAVMRKGGEIWI